MGFFQRSGVWLAIALGLAVGFSPRASAVDIEWVIVGAPGNTCDPQSQGCFGAVGYEYRIAKYEITNAQYAEFLNAVATTDTYQLYNTSMGSGRGGITRTGNPGSHAYTAIAEREDKPVNYVSVYDAMRFANWLGHGQPTGGQDLTTTEGGAYTITAGGIGTNSITRNPGAIVFLTSEDEWYKAAYYDALSATYFDYPAATDTPITCSSPTSSPNHANCYFQVNDLTNVGSYTGSPGPFGTFDQGGNASEWTETVYGPVELHRRVRRGAEFRQIQTSLAASNRGNETATGEYDGTGFRVASLVPEPGTGLLVMTGLLGLACRQDRIRRAALGPHAARRIGGVRGNVAVQTPATTSSPRS